MKVSACCGAEIEEIGSVDESISTCSECDQNVEGLGMINEVPADYCAQCYGTDTKDENWCNDCGEYVAIASFNTEEEFLKWKRVRDSFMEDDGRF